MTGTTIQIQLDTTANIDDSSSGSTLKVGNTVVFTHSSNLTWTVGATYYSSSARPIPDGNMVLFAKTRAASNNFKGYGLLKAHTFANGEMDFIRTTDDPDADGFATNGTSVSTARFMTWQSVTPLYMDELSTRPC